MSPVRSSRTFWIAAPSAALALWLVSLGAARPAPAQATCNVWLHEPLVAYDVTGSTFAGPYDESLHVYANGVVKHFSASEGKAAVVYVTPQEARLLAQDLFQVGAFALCDQPEAGADIPLQTLTLFRGPMDAAAHTFNWWSDEGLYTVPAGILRDFIAAHVP